MLHLESSSRSRNIDVQSVLAFGYAGPRYHNQFDRRGLPIADPLDSSRIWSMSEASYRRVDPPKPVLSYLLVDGVLSDRLALRELPT